MARGRQGNPELCTQISTRAADGWVPGCRRLRGHRRPWIGLARLQPVEGQNEAGLDTTNEEVAEALLADRPHLPLGNWFARGEVAEARTVFIPMDVSTVSKIEAELAPGYLEVRREVVDYLGNPGTAGSAVTPSRCTRRRPISITHHTEAPQGWCRR